jgi:hypothetical protein
MKKEGEKVIFFRVLLSSPGFSQTSQRNRVDCDRSWICCSEPGEGVLKYVEVGDQDKSGRWHEIRDCSRRAVRNSGEICPLRNAIYIEEVGSFEMLLAS